MDQICNTYKSKYDIRDYKLKAKDYDFPETFSLKEVPVKNQYSTGSCAAFACSEIVEYQNLIQEKNYQPFSTEFIYGCREDDDYKGEGMCLRDALDTLKKYGDVYNSVLPGNHYYEQAAAKVAKRETELKEKAYPHRISSYVQLKSIDQIKYALIHYGYVLISMRWYSNYTFFDNVYQPDYDIEEEESYHAVVIYGWNEKGWLVQNSWGTDWGDKGRFILPFDFEISESWGIQDNIINNKEDYKIKPKLFNWLYIIINNLINFLTSR